MSKFDDCAAKLEHLEQPVALHLIYEWTKTGHINLAEFKGLVGRVMITPQIQRAQQIAESGRRLFQSDEIEPDTESGFVK